MKRALALIVLLAALDAQAVVATVYPATPTANEPFIVNLQGSTPGFPSQVVSQNFIVNGSEIAVNFVVTDSGFSVPGVYSTGIIIPGLAAGTYNYVVSSQYAGPVPPSQASGTITVTPSSGPSTAFSQTLSANWFSDDEAGWGINVVQGGSGQLFAIWATYGSTCPGLSNSGPWWLVIPDGRWLSPTLFRGLVYETKGSPVDQPWDATQAGIAPVGVLSLQFVDNDHVNVDAEVANACGNISKTKSLHRLQF